MKIKKKVDKINLKKLNKKNVIKKNGIIVHVLNHGVMMKKIVKLVVMMKTAAIGLNVKIVQVVGAMKVVGKEVKNAVVVIQTFMIGKIYKLINIH
jgi:hypothetical protein